MAALLQELTEAERASGTADVEAVARRHPHVAEELRALWAVAEAASALVAVINKPWPPEVVALDRALRKYEAVGAS